MAYAHTSHNRSVTASPPYGGSASAKPCSGLSLLQGFAPEHLEQGRCFATPYYLPQTTVTAGTLNDIY